MNKGSAVCILERQNIALALFLLCSLYGIHNLLIVANDLSTMILNCIGK